MARTSIRERPDREEVLWPVQTACPACGHPMRLRYDNCRTLVRLSGPGAAAAEDPALRGG